MRGSRNFRHGFWGSRPKLTKSSQLIFKRDPTGLFQKKNIIFQVCVGGGGGPAFSRGVVHLLIPKETYSIELVTFFRGGS